MEQRISDIKYEVEYESRGRERAKILEFRRYHITGEERWNTVPHLNNPDDYLLRAPAAETTFLTYVNALYSKN